MTNFIRTNMIVIIAIIIGTYYGYTEYNKHQFNMDLMTKIDQVSIAVVTITFMIIVFIGISTTQRNVKLYKFLQNEIDELNFNESNNTIFTTMKEQYHELVVDEYSTVNVPSFLESFMATYVYKKNSTIPKELKNLQSNTSTPILVGVLGTFVGLVMALSQLEIGDMNNSLNLQPILNGVGTAFYTSITGVLFSILIGMNLRHYNSDQLFIQHMLKSENLLYKESKNRSEEKVVDTLVTVRQEIINMRTSFEDVSTFSKEFKKASLNLQAFNKDFSSNISDMKLIFESTKDVMSLFNSRTAQFHEDFERLFDYFKKNEDQHELLTTRQVEINAKLQDTFEKNKQFQEGALGYLNQLQGAFNDSVEKQATQFSEASSIMETVSDSINSQFETVVGSQKSLMEAQNKIGEANIKQIDTIEETTKAMKSILDNSNFDNLTEASKMFTNSTDQIHNVVNQFVETYKDMQDSSRAHYDALGGIMKKMKNMFDVHSNVSEKQATELQSAIQLITKYQEDLQQAVIRFLNNDFDYDKLRKILDEARENMDIQNQFLLKQLSSFEAATFQPTPQVPIPDYVTNR